MHKLGKAVLRTLIAVFLFASPLFGADALTDIEVLEPNTPIYAEPSPTSKVITKVKQGQRLQATSEKAGYYQLKTKSGKPMWIATPKVKQVDDPAADLETSQAPKFPSRRAAVHYPRFSFDVSGAAGSNTFGSFYELQGGVNMYFNAWFVWRNAPFYRFFGNYSAFGWDTSLRAQAALPTESITPTLWAGAGYRFITLGTSAPFVEAGVGIHTGNLNFSVGGKYLFNTFIDSTSQNQFLYSVGISGGGSF
jgi:hypothetical protein